MKGDQEVVWPNSALPGWAALAGKKMPVTVGECHASLPDVRQRPVSADAWMAAARAGSTT